jgi:hypothetical protein
MNSASLCSLAGRYDNPIPTRFLAPIDCLKIPAQGMKNPGRNDQGRIGQGRIVMLSVRHRCHGRKDFQQGIGCASLGCVL